MSEILRFQKSIMRLVELNEQPAPPTGIRCKHLIRHQERLMLDRAKVAIRSIERMAERGQITDRQRQQMIANVQRHIRKYGG